ncbi:hypothetical protein SAMN05192555_10456 [Franzmannia pantelleriensis]|uniref:Uncharacterized protein n=1 Tax=Franzmannia pantelleriensis TaxID=48727 RepID=A0A1G9JIY1_9GAMM|nr:hypothetical protein [Halomonas pantelleriensis]SDL37489.1 hypothetical protein SAMN05192555_10456 [Halomonas pantelleriensis]
MKRKALITTTLIASIFTLGMASQAAAAESTQVRFEVGSPALGGTREGMHEYRVRTEVEEDQAVEGPATTFYSMAFEVGSPALGGTREGIHRERVEVEQRQAPDQKSEYAGPRVGSPRQGTTG